MVAVDRRGANRRPDRLVVGVVSEVVTYGRAVDRGIEIARGLAAKPALYSKLQKQTLNRNLLRRITKDVPFGIALEGLTAADLPYQDQA